MIPIENQITPFILLIIISTLLSLCIIYSKTNENIGSQREVRAFKGMLISFMVYTLVDLRLIFAYNMPFLLTYIISSIGFATMTFSSFFWFLYVRASIHHSNRSASKTASTILGIIIHVPLLINLIILFTPLCKLVIEVNETGLMFKPLTVVITLIDYIYLTVATAISIRNRIKATTKSEKKKFNIQIIFIIIYTISGMIIGFMLFFPAIEICIIPIVIKLFVELQDSQIYTDALTKLYNRRRITELINQELSTCSEEKPLSVIMIDLDHFKSINDILGHEYGDKALVTFSKALNSMLSARNAYAARWGGDEFIVACKDKALSDIFSQMLSEALENNSDLDFIPLFSLGIYNCTSPSITCEQALAKADSYLYEEKNSNRGRSDEFIRTLTEIKTKSLS